MADSADGSGASSESAGFFGFPALLQSTGARAAAAAVAPPAASTAVHTAVYLHTPWSAHAHTANAPRSGLDFPEAHAGARAAEGVRAAGAQTALETASGAEDSYAPRRAQREAERRSRRRLNANGARSSISGRSTSGSSSYGGVSSIATAGPGGAGGDYNRCQEWMIGVDKDHLEGSRQLDEVMRGCRSPLWHERRCASS